MMFQEAVEWIQGKRSMANLFRSMDAPMHEREAALARADAAMTEQAYWIVRAASENLP